MLIAIGTLLRGYQQWLVKEGKIYWCILTAYLKSRIGRDSNEVCPQNKYEGSNSAEFMHEAIVGHACSCWGTNLKLINWKGIHSFQLAATALFQSCLSLAWMLLDWPCTHVDWFVFKVHAEELKGNFQKSLGKIFRGIGKVVATMHACEFVPLDGQQKAHQQNMQTWPYSRKELWLIVYIWSLGEDETDLQDK